MTLQEFLEAKEPDINCTVYSYNYPVYNWFENDPRYNCEVLRFGVASETEIWVDIDEEVY